MTTDPTAFHNPFASKVLANDDGINENDEPPSEFSADELLALAEIDIEDDKTLPLTGDCEVSESIEDSAVELGIEEHEEETPMRPEVVDSISDALSHALVMAELQEIHGPLAPVSPPPPTPAPAPPPPPEPTTVPVDEMQLLITLEKGLVSRFKVRCPIHLQRDPLAFRKFVIGQVMDSIRRDIGY